MSEKKREMFVFIRRADKLPRGFCHALGAGNALTERYNKPVLVSLRDLSPLSWLTPRYQKHLEAPLTVQEQLVEVILHFHAQKKMALNQPESYPLKNFILSFNRNSFYFIGLSLSENCVYHSLAIEVCVDLVIRCVNTPRCQLWCVGLTQCLGLGRPLSLKD